ncbi:MAG: D-Ala-D-Ala carboxypeptidase family metallohydrolase [Paraclostridium sp.]
MNLKEVIAKYGEKASPNFTYAELLHSDTAKKQKISNVITESSVENLKRLASILQEIRGRVGVPLSISSGFRCEKLNVAVGGTANSAHKFGRAADVKCKLSPKELFELIRFSAVAFDKIILYPTFVHIGINDSLVPPKRQVLMAVGNGQYRHITHDMVI